MSGSSSFHAHMVSANSLLLGSGDELDLCTSERFELAGLVVNKTLLDTIWADLFAGASVPFATLHFAKLTDGVASETLRQAFRLAFDVARYEPTFNPLLLRDALIESWVGVLSKDEVIPDLRAASARQRLVHRTIDTLHTLIEAGDGHMPTLLTLCRHVGASPRKLNYCFQETLGLSPKNYLRAYRLNQVKRELRAAGGLSAERGLVQQVAAKWGFWHLGQFSADYKRQFSELPSQTLRLQ
jgi:AraC family transcriptional regulator, ethanolamine operon transcriptional activator